MFPNENKWPKHQEFSQKPINRFSFRKLCTLSLSLSLSVYVWKFHDYVHSVNAIEIPGNKIPFPCCLFPKKKEEYVFI